MNHGSLGFINDIGNLTLRQDVLNALCLLNNSRLYGIYYPCPPEDAGSDYANSTLKHDFMLTPIPPRLWAVSARIHIHMLQNKSGTLNQICKLFEAKRISIIHAESTRSTHRYASWSLHIAFEKLLNSKRTFDSKNNYYLETYQAVEDLKRDVAENPEWEEIRKILFSPDYHKSFDGGPNAPLAYFTNYINSENTPWLSEKWLKEPFEFELKTDINPNYLIGDSKFNEIFKYLKSINPDIFPATTFSELDTRALNIRTVIIPKKDNKRFFMVGMEYERIGGLDSCIGVIRAVTSKFPSEYNIWQSYNHTIKSSPNFEEGNLVYLIEDTTNRSRPIDNKSREAYLEEAAKNFEDIANGNVHDLQNIKFKHPTIAPLPDYEATRKLLENNLEERKFKDHKSDVFISYSHQDTEFVTKTLIPILQNHNVKYTIDSEIFRFGNKIDSTLLARIIDSREMCVIVSNSKSDWVSRESGVAWVLGMNYVPIIKSPDVDISDQLKNIYYVKGFNEDELIKYAIGLSENRIKSEANRFERYFS